MLATRLLRGAGVDAPAFNAVLLQHGAVVAGSFALEIAAQLLNGPSAQPADVDVWVPQDDCDAFLRQIAAILPLHELSASAPSSYPILATRFQCDVAGLRTFVPKSNAPTGALPVQVMCCRKSVWWTVGSFDLTVSQVVWTGRDLMLAPKTAKDVRLGRLRLNRKALHRQSPEEMGRTMRRVKKYEARGYPLASTAPLHEAVEALMLPTSPRASAYDRRSHHLDVLK